MGVVIESDRWDVAEVLPTAAGPTPVPVLALDDVHAAHGRRAVLHGVSIAAGASDVVALLGANGSGRSTALQVLSGQVAPTAGRVTRPDELGCVGGDVAVFPTLTVRDNLRLGGADHRAGFSRFPELEAIGRRRAGELDAGQQRLLAVAAALGRHPKALVVDELSRATPPATVDRAFLAIRQAADDGMAVVVADQHIRRALSIADHVVVLRLGTVAWEGTVEEAHRRIAEIEAEYLNPIT
jgi:ABC-type branched-subunit amino acid transport system ATPase component